MAWDANGRWIPDPPELLPQMQPQSAQPAGLLSAGLAATPRAPATGPALPGPSNPNAVPTSGGLLATPTAEDRLTKMIGSDSAYMQQARQGGIRTANRRGLLNSSIAAGAGEAAAIAAAAPIASQDAASAAQLNEIRLQGQVQFDNSSRLQTQQQAGAVELQRLQDAGAKERQTMAAADELNRLGIQVAAQANNIDRENASQLTLAQISANNNLVQSYLSVFGSMSQNENLPAGTRDAYINEMKTVISQGMALTTQLAGKQVTWGAPTPGTGPAPAPDAYTRYLANNPDVQAEYARNSGRFATPAEFARWHYENYGKQEGRAL